LIECVAKGWVTLNGLSPAKQFLPEQYTASEFAFKSLSLQQKNTLYHGINVDNEIDDN
jgi:hypothetical protein